MGAIETYKETRDMIAKERERLLREAIALNKELLAQRNDMLAALEAAVVCMETAMKFKNPDWDGSATPSSAIGAARAAIARARGVMSSANNREERA